jgi:Uma2 family endonuclease
MKTLDELDTSLKWYFEMHPEEEDMGEGYHHRNYANYLQEVLRWYYRAEKYLILADQLVFIDRNRTTSPDIAVIKVPDAEVHPSEGELFSWRISPPDRPAPDVTIEISSDGNWGKDIEEDKLPKVYGELGVKEYFACDPFGYWGEAVQIKGWRYKSGKREKLKLVKGRMLSAELGCWLNIRDDRVVLEDQGGKLLLTKAEAREKALWAEYNRAEQEYQRAEQEYLRAEQERERAEAERQAKELERERAGQERQELERQLEVERQEKERFAAKLREHNIDLDTL